jgi:hypothetical protein
MKNSEKTETQSNPIKAQLDKKESTKKKRIANLKPFKKGQSGNLNGRPKKLPKLDDLLAEVLGEEVGGKTVAKSILIKLSQKAKAGDVRAAELVLDRAYGKAKQSMEITEKTIIVETQDDQL